MGVPTTTEIPEGNRGKEALIVIVGVILMDFHGFGWICMDFHGFGWVWMDLNGNQSKSKKIDEICVIYSNLA